MWIKQYSLYWGGLELNSLCLQDMPLCLSPPIYIYIYIYVYMCIYIHTSILCMYICISHVRIRAEFCDYNKQWFHLLVHGEESSFATAFCHFWFVSPLTSISLWRYKHFYLNNKKNVWQINIKAYCQRYDKAGGWTTIVIFKSKLPFGPALSSENYNVSHICNLKFSGGHTE